MPGRDGRGPQGAGAGTGGRRGGCFGGTREPRGAGRGMRFCGRVQAEYSTQALKNRAAALECELEEVRRRLEADAGQR